MGRKLKWILGKFEKVEARIYTEKKRRYEMVLKAKGKTIQQDIEEHIDNLLK